MSKAIDHKTLLDQLENGIAVFDRNLHLLYANQRCLQWLGFDSIKQLNRFMHSDAYHLLNAQGDQLNKDYFPAYQVLNLNRAVYNLEIGIPDPNNPSNYFWFLCDSYFQEETDQQKIIVTLTKVESHKELIPFRRIVEYANDAVIITEADKEKGSSNAIVYVNRRVMELTGYSEEEIIGSSTELFRGEKTSPITSKKIFESMTQGRSIREEIINYKKDGTPYWVDVNLVPLFNDRHELTYYAAIERDVTKTKGKATDLEKLANTDTLTEVLNRRGLYREGEHIIGSSYAAKHAFILAILDIDNFKPINDSYGHPVGDLVLKGIADVLKLNLRSRDLIARLGGEEFVVIIEGEPLPVLLKRVEDLRKEIEDAEFSINDVLSINVTASFGIAVSGDEEHSLDQLIEFADVALYRSKQDGRNRITVNHKFEMDHPQED